MYSLSDQLPAHFTICSVLMVKHITNGVILMPDSTHIKNQEIIGSLNQQDQDIGQLNQQLIPITSCLDFKMKEMATSSALEPIHLLKIEINGSLMDSMDELYFKINKNYQWNLDNHLYLFHLNLLQLLLDIFQLVQINLEPYRMILMLDVFKRSLMIPILLLNKSKKKYIS